MSCRYVLKFFTIVKNEKTVNIVLFFIDTLNSRWHASEFCPIPTCTYFFMHVCFIYSALSKLFRHFRET